MRWRRFLRFTFYAQGRTNDPTEADYADIHQSRPTLDQPRLLGLRTGVAAAGDAPTRRYDRWPAGCAGVAGHPRGRRTAHRPAARPRSRGWSPAADHGAAG